MSKDGPRGASPLEPAESAEMLKRKPPDGGEKAGQSGGQRRSEGQVPTAWRVHPGVWP